MTNMPEQLERPRTPDLLMPPATAAAARLPRRQSQNGTAGSALVAAVLGLLALGAEMMPQLARGVSPLAVHIVAAITLLFAIGSLAGSARRLRPLSALLAAIGLIASGFVVAGAATDFGNSISTSISAGITNADSSLPGLTSSDQKTIATVLHGEPTAADLSNALQPMVLLLQSDHASDKPYPSHLIVRKTGEVDPPSGLALGGIPNHTNLSYVMLGKGTGFRLSLTDAKNAEVSATYSTATGRFVVHGAE